MRTLTSCVKQPVLQSHRRRSRDERGTRRPTFPGERRANAVKCTCRAKAFPLTRSPSFLTVKKNLPYWATTKRLTLRTVALYWSHWHAMCNFRHHLLSLSLASSASGPALVQAPISSVGSGSVEDRVTQLERISNAHSQLLTQLQQQLSDNQSGYRFFARPNPRKSVSTESGDGAPEANYAAAGELK